MGYVIHFSGALEWTSGDGVYALRAGGIACRPRDKGENAGHATDDRTSVTCKACLNRIQMADDTARRKAEQVGGSARIEALLLALKGDHEEIPKLDVRRYGPRWSLYVVWGPRSATPLGNDRYTSKSEAEADAESRLREELQKEMARQRHAATAQEQEIRIGEEQIAWHQKRVDHAKTMADAAKARAGEIELALAATEKKETL